MKKERIPVPVQTGEWVHIYKPQPDVYLGLDTENFRHGSRYETWITNDFSIIRDDGMWRMVGITHPKPPAFVDAFNYEAGVHEAEFQLFHATAVGGDFAEVFREGAFCDQKKLLYPAERPGDGRELWAPHLMKREGKYHIIYSPHIMRRAVSEDLKSWQILPMFTCDSGAARDPYLYEEDGTFYCIYTESRQLLCRTSEDLVDWSAPFVLQKSMFNCENESPCFVKRDGWYYLFWSSYDGRNGCYDHRTFVFAGRTMAELYDSAPITMLRGHAPEVIESGGAWYFLSVFYPENGISAIKLNWE